MSPTSLPFRVCVIFVLIYSSRLHALRGYNLIIKSVECTFNPEYVARSICSVGKSAAIPGVNMEFWMKKEVKVPRMDFIVTAEKDNLPSITLCKAKDLSVCNFWTTNQTIPILQMFRESILRSVVYMPNTCPTFPADYHVLVRNITLDVEYMPSFLPSATFRSFAKYKDRNVDFWGINLVGDVVHNKAIKSKKNPGRN